MNKIKVLELFGGISAPHKALLNLGVNVETIDYVEFNPKVVEIRNAMYNTNFEPKSVVGYTCNEDIDLLIGGSPCQSFSLAGNQEGGDIGSETRSSLMWEQLRIIEETMPKITIWENVKNVLSKKHLHNFETYQTKLEQLGYTNHHVVLNANDFGIPQNRERVFLVSIRNDINIDFDFDNLQKKELPALSDFVDFTLNYENTYNKTYKNYKSYYALENNKGIYNTQSWRLYSKDSPYVGTLGCSTSYKIGAKIKEDLFTSRRLNAKEALLLMGFDANDYNNVKHFKDSEIHHVSGNSIVVPVLEAIFKELLIKE